MAVSVGNGQRLVPQTYLPLLGSQDTIAPSDQLPDLTMQPLTANDVAVSVSNGRTLLHFSATGG